MKAQITIHMDNDAFKYDPVEETRRILRELEYALRGETFDKERGYALRDINGNCVGEMKVTGTEVD